MKRTVCFLSFFLFVLANTCFASIQLPIIDNVDAQIYIETFNEKNTKLKFQEVTHDNHPRFGETYNCRLTDNRSMLSFGIKEDKIYMLSMITPVDNYTPALETLAFILSEGGMSQEGIGKLHDNLVKTYKSGKACIIDRTDKEFQMEASPMEKSLFVGISCWEKE